MPKKVLKIAEICVDITMYVVFLLLMSRHLLSGAVHEWLGVSLFVLFIAHNVLNCKWYGALLKGKYNALRIVQTTVDFLLLAAMILCIVSSLLISGVVFKWLNLSGASVGREIHLAATAWTFILMSIHLGLHWSNFIAIGKKIKTNKTVKTIVVWALRLVVSATFAFGVYMFATRKFYEELFLLTAFKFFDYDKSLFAYTFGTFALSTVFVSVAYYGKKLYFVIKGKTSKSYSDGEVK